MNICGCKEFKYSLNATKHIDIQLFIHLKYHMLHKLFEQTLFIEKRTK